MKDFLKKIYLKITGLALLPLFALGEGSQDTGGGLFTNPLGNSTDLSTLVENLAKYATQIGATIAVVMIIYSGYKFVAAQGEPKKIEDARRTFTYTVIGTGILLGAWVLATAIKQLIEGLG